MYYVLLFFVLVFLTGCSYVSVDTNAGEKTNSTTHTDELKIL